MDLEREVRRLRAWNCVWMGVVLLCAIWGLWAGPVLEGVRHPPLRLVRDADTVRLSATSDGPFVVTALVSSGSSEPEKRWAALDPPLIIVDSHGGEVSLRDLAWRDYLGTATNPPRQDQPLRALYLRPEVAQPR